MTGKVKFNGERALKKALAALSAKAQNRISRRGIAKAAQVYRKEMRARAPTRRTGNLHRNLRYKVRRKRPGHFTAKVGPSGAAYYARFIEFGTQPHRIPSSDIGRGKNKRKNDARVKIGEGVYTSVYHPGTSAKPFLRPAYDAATQKAVDEAKKTIWSEIKKELTTLKAQK